MEAEERPIAVIDTNVIVETHSFHDFSNAFDKRHGEVGDNDAALGDEKVAARLQRARDALLLAIHLHETRATTWGLHEELITILDKNVPSSAFHDRFEVVFTTVWVHYTHPTVLSGWRHTIPASPDGAARNDADRAIVAKAKELGVPVISNEGASHTGDINEKKLVRRLGREQNVSVYFPREFFRGKLDERAASERFMQRFRDLSPPYLKQHFEQFGPDEISDAMAWISGVYRFILLGARGDKT